MKLKLLSLAAIMAFSTVANADLFLGGKYPHIGANTSFDGKADIKNSKGSAKFSTYRLNIGNELLDLQYKRTNVDFENVVNAPFDGLNYLSLDLRPYGVINLGSNIDAFVGINIGFGFESDFNPTENYNINPRAGFAYNLNRDYAFYLGATAFINEAENDVLPILGFQVKDNKRETGFSGSIGYPATQLTYRLDRNLSVNTTLLVNKELYQMKGSQHIPNDGYLYDESTGATLGLTYENEYSSFNVGVQSIFDRKFSAYDSSGNKRGSIEFDNSVGFYVNFNIKL